MVELLVVMAIIMMVSVVAIPPVMQAYGERSIQSAATLVQSTLSAATADAARHGGQHGVRFTPDPAAPDTCSRLLPIGPAPDYSEGLLTTTDIAHLPQTFIMPFPCLMVEDARTDASGLTTSPVSWARNVRVGDRLRIGDAGPWLTVVGPTDPANPTDELFITPTRVLDRGDGRGPLDYLWLVNGVDDDGDGFIDDGWDGVDNDANGLVDDPAEWEVEHWQRHVPVLASSYTISRRPVPVGPGRGVELPAGVVIDTTGLPGEILLDATGASVASGPYGVPTRIGLNAHEFKIHLVERGVSGNEAWVVINARTGAVSTDVRTP